MIRLNQELAKLTLLKGIEKKIPHVRRKIKSYNLLVMKVKILSNDNKIKNIDNFVRESEKYKSNLKNFGLTNNGSFLPKIIKNFDDKIDFISKSNGSKLEPKLTSNKSELSYLKNQENIIKNQQLKPIKILEKNAIESSNKFDDYYGELSAKLHSIEKKESTVSINQIGNPRNQNVSEAINYSSISTNLQGLDNLGNSCYMNTGLQIVIYTEIFLKELFKQFSTSTRSTSITKAFYDLCKEIIEKSNSKTSIFNNSMRTSISPINFKKTFGNLHKNFSGHAQHDTQEFIRLFLEDISKELNRVIEIPKYEELDTSSANRIKLNSEFDQLFRRREDSIIIDIFYGQTVNIFKCLECNYETFSFEKFLDIPLLLERESFNGFSVEELLDDFFKIDKFKWDTPCENKACKKKSFHQKTSKIGQLPSILTISIQRYNNRYRIKNSSTVKFKEVLDIAKYIDKECVLSGSDKFSISVKYKLYAISNHTGSLEFGHYYAYVNISNAWYEFNDSHVSKCITLNKSSTTAYVLFYKRERDE